jgi:DNA-binding CsgD family transcriptional regulator
MGAMEKRNDMVFWLRAVAYVTIVGVGISLTFAGADRLPLVLGGLGVFLVLHPTWSWVRRLPPEGLFALILAEGALVTAGLFGTDHPGTVMILFFVLIPTCSRLPRQYSLLCYVLFTLMACLPFLFAPGRTIDWASLSSMVPGFVSIVVFTEAFSQVRQRSQENQKLLDELVQAQRLVRDRSGDPGSEPAPPMVASGPFTRRDREVLGLVAMGFSNKEIADRLCLAEGTVKNRVSAILEKTGVRDRTQAALRARELGIL